MTPAAADRGSHARTFRQVGDGSYELTVLSLGIQLTVDRLRRERHELIGELAVACDLAGAHTIDGFISVADFNLSSAQARVTRAKLLADRSEAADVDWFSFVEELCVRTIAADRQGTPSRPLHQFERASADALFDVDGWPLLRDHPTILFGDGGGLKSMLALYAAGLLSRQGVPVGFCDWELSGYEHRDRFERLFGPDSHLFGPGGLPAVHYLRCDRPLTDESDRISREVRRLSLEYVVFDSAGFATAGPPEAAEHALAFFRAARQIGVGSLSLAHVNRSETGDQKPFGSSFWHNSARATWYAKAASTSVDGRRLTVGLFNKKSNLTRLAPALAFQFDFAGDRTCVSRVNVADIDDLATQLPLWQRMRSALAHGPLTMASLAEDLGAKVETIERTVRRKDGLFMRVSSADGVTRIALVERRSA